MIAVLVSMSALATNPRVTAVPDADRPPMIKGEARCVATIAYDATGKATGADVAEAECAELFRAATRMAAESVVLAEVTGPGAITLQYAFGPEGNGIPTVVPTSMPVLGLKYSGIEVLSQKAPKFPKGVASDGPVTCQVALTVDAEGAATEVKPSGCPDVFQSAVQDVLEKWEFKVPPNPPEGGVPTEISVTFTPK
jgi:hypothetical protein